VSFTFKKKGCVLGIMQIKEIKEMLRIIHGLFKYLTSEEVDEIVNLLHDITTRKTHKSQ